MDSENNADVWIFHYACMRSVKRRIESFKTHYNNNPLSTKGNKILKKITTSRIKHQVINHKVDSLILNYLNYW